MLKRIAFVVTAALIAVAVAACTPAEETTTMTTTYWAPEVGTATNDESLADLALIYSDPTATDLAVLPVENLTEDFIYGVDISTVLAVYENGGVYYDRDGVEKDVFVILREAGVNSVRIRLWVDPYDADGNPYGGGTNDLETALKLASRAKAVGMTVCLDFHYSDFWADPTQQEVPKAWAALTFTELQAKVYEYTKEALEAFAALDALPDMVQLGNEINPGMLFPLGAITNQPASWTRLAAFLKQAAQAVEDVSSDIQTIIHLAEGANFETFDRFFGKMAENNVPYDIIGLSYYSYWHGSIADFTANMNQISAKYGKPVCVMEMAYGFTTLANDHAGNIYNEGLEDTGGYKTSLQGQASYMRDVINAVANVPGGLGLGIYYWEPAWLPIEGAGWASIASGRTNEEGKSSWANQGLFSYSGKALPTLYILELIANASADIEITILPGSVVTELDVTLNVSLHETLPMTTTAIDSLHRYTIADIIWDETEFNAVDSPGLYVVHGTLASDASVVIVANVTAVANYIVNPGLEDRGTSGQDVVPPWYRDDANGVKTNQTDARTGTGHVNVWDDVAFDYDIYQDIELPAGTYQLSFWAMGAAAEQPTILLYAAFAASGIDLVVSDNCVVTWWPEYNQFTISFTLTEAATIRIGVRGEGAAGNWCHFDDFILQKTSE